MRLGCHRMLACTRTCAAEDDRQHDGQRERRREVQAEQERVARGVAQLALSQRRKLARPWRTPAPRPWRAGRRSRHVVRKRSDSGAAIVHAVDAARCITCGGGGAWSTAQRARARPALDHVCSQQAHTVPIGGLDPVCVWSTSDPQRGRGGMRCMHTCVAEV
eukprot:357522-Chlamydomonas_euryale.AAC.2